MSPPEFSSSGQNAHVLNWFHTVTILLHFLHGGDFLHLRSKMQPMSPVSAPYRARVAAGEIESDPAQVGIVERLDALALELSRPRTDGGLLGRLFGKQGQDLRGVYIWGDVGRGKSMIMDMFFDAAPASAKRRVHFHAFMVDMHARVHRLRASGADGDDPILSVADDLASETRLLCLDEMQVTDIADAMMLSRLFGRLFERGLVLVTTSNAPPDGLYAGGLNRDRFLPFVHMLNSRLDVMELDARTDYRREKEEASARVWHVPPGAASTAALDRAYVMNGGSDMPETLRVQGRDVVVPKAGPQVARFTFDDLFRTARGPADYGAIARRYPVLIIDGIPRLDGIGEDVTRRFVLLVDEIYDNRVRLFASAEAEPAALLTAGRQAWVFQRTASRLTEITSASWPEAETADMQAS
jgi:cell division protein ZapE